MNTEEILKLKKLLDEGIISQEEFEAEKAKYLSTNNKKNSNRGLIIGIVSVVFLCMLIITGNTPEEQQNNVQNEVIEEKVPKEFAADFPIAISGKMYDNIIEFPELSLHITNSTDKDISAIKFYFLPRDVYGEEAEGIFTTNELYTDDTISAGESATKTWQMIDSTIKAGDVYVYSVYFADGTEWGNKEATVGDIKKYGYKLQVKY